MRNRHHASPCPGSLGPGTSAPGDAVRAVGLTRRFGSFVAVDALDLTVPTGSVYGLLGPNGAGKSTVVRMLTTLVPPSAGSATVMGHDLRTAAHHVRRSIGVAGQYASVDETLTGRENLRLFSRLTGLSHRDSRTRTDELLEAFSLTAAADRQVRGYSGGMRRRLDLATSLVAAPELVFLDEPTTGLDPRTREQMWEVVEGLVGTGTTVLLTTQYLEEADRLADRIGILDHGRLVAEGTADELKDRIGRSSLTLSMRDADDERVAGEVIDALLGARARVTRSPGRLRVLLGEGAAGVAADVLVALRERGAVPDAVSLDRPTLDAVFLEMTRDVGTPSGALPIQQPDTTAQENQ